MANGAFKFKDNSGNVVSFISGSGSNILFYGGTLDLSGMTGLTIGNRTLSGTTQNAISASHAESYLLTSSFNTYSGTTNTLIGTLATTASNQFKSDQVITGSLTVTGFIDAQELRTTYISSSILYRSGSTKFGDELTDNHLFSGSLLVSGSVSSTDVITGTGNAATSPSFIANNTTGASGTSQYYMDFKAGTTNIGRIFRGNGASGVVGNGLNIDNYDGFQVRLNQLGGSGGSFNVSGGNVGINASSATRMLTLGSSSGSHGYIALYGPGSNEGNIYHTSTYGIYMDTNTNLLPIRIDGSKLVIGVTGDVIAGSSGTPEGKMDIKGGALVVDVSNNGYGGLKIDDDTGGDYNVNFRAGRGGTNDGFIWYLNARPSGGGAFSTGNERMRLTNTGLGVGISNPLGKLHIRSSGITAAAPSNGWPVYNAEADTNSRRIYIDTAGNDNITTASYGATVSIELGGYFDSRAVITTQSAGSGSPSDQGQGRGKDLMIKAGTADNTNGYKGGRLYLNGGMGYQGGFGSNGGDVLIQTISGSGNVGINTTAPSAKLEVNGNIRATGKFYTFIDSTSNSGGAENTVTIDGGCLYEYAIEVNPNPGGSSGYKDYYYGKVGVGIGWNGSALTQYIFIKEEQTAPRSLYSSGGGNITLTARLYYSGGVYTELPAGTTCQIRFQGFGGGNYVTTHLRRLS